MEDANLTEVLRSFHRLGELCNTVDVALVAYHRGKAFELLSARVTAGATTARREPMLIEGSDWFAVRVRRPVRDFTTLVDWTKRGRYWGKLHPRQPSEVVLSHVPVGWFANGFGRSRVPVFGAGENPITANGGTTWGRLFPAPHTFRDWVNEIEAMDAFHDLASFVNALALRQPFYAHTDVCQMHAEVEVPLYEQQTVVEPSATTVRFSSPISSWTDLKAKWKRGSQTGQATIRAANGFVDLVVDGPPAAFEISLVHGDQPLAKVAVPAPAPQPTMSRAPYWEDLDAGAFERAIFDLLSRTPGYENPNLLTNTNAADRARDIEVHRVHADALAGTIRHRVIVQCKHWRSRPVGVPDIAEALAKMQLWGHVDVLVIATSGRLTSDAVQWIEQHNARSSLPRIECWNDVQLERLGVAASRAPTTDDARE